VRLGVGGSRVTCRIHVPSYDTDASTYYEIPTNPFSVILKEPSIVLITMGSLVVGD